MEPTLVRKKKKVRKQKGGDDAEYDYVYAEPPVPVSSPPNHHSPPPSPPALISPRISNAQRESMNSHGLYGENQRTSVLADGMPRMSTGGDRRPSIILGPGQPRISIGANVPVGKGRSVTLMPPPRSSFNDNDQTLLVELPRRVELKTPGAGPEISKFEKRKKKAKEGKIKVFQDAANSCAIEMDDFGNLLSVMLSDDLQHTYLKFGKEDHGEAPPIILQENGYIPITAKKKPFTKIQPRDTRWAGNQLMYVPTETTAGIGQNKHYKRIRVKKTKLKGKKAPVELLFAADKADLVVEEYCDKVGKIYVAFPDRRTHRTYLFALPDRLNVITEEFSREIPIRRAIDDKANWYVQDTSSEESEEEEEVKPQMAEAGANAVTDEIPVNLRMGSIGFKDDGFVRTWSINGQAPPNTRLIME